MPLKFDFYHFGSDLDEPLPILDWDGWYAKKLFDHCHKGPGQNGFTGKYNSVLYVSLVIFRYKICLRIDFAFGQTTPELAYNEYHSRIKAARQRD